MKNDSADYIQKKTFFSQLLTIYGRKPVHEALQTQGVKVYRLHLSESNKDAAILTEIIRLAKAQNAEITYHTKEALSRISKNKKQDQGVAVDLKLDNFIELNQFRNNNKHVNDVGADQTTFELIALDRVTNPQNLGMIVRSVCASPMTGLLIPRKGCAKLDSLVIKASAGTLFKAPIIRCDNLVEGLEELKANGAKIIGLDLKATHKLSDQAQNESKVFVLGNETEGLSAEVQKCCNTQIKIPMHNGVESLNVAITASLIAFRGTI